MRQRRQLKKGFCRPRNLYEYYKHKKKQKARFKRLYEISTRACLFVTVVSKLNDIMREGLHLEPGGIVRENPPQLNNKGEMVIAKDEAHRLADYINQGSTGITCAIKGDNLLKTLDNIKTRLKVQVKI